MSRICIVGHSGAGKSTTAALLRDGTNERGLSCVIVKIAAPLYELQAAFYRRLGIELAPGQQDQRLLEHLATHIRDVNPRFLVKDFLARADRADADLLVNDDVRSWDLDYPELRARGWISIRVFTAEACRRTRLATLGYLSLSDESTRGVEDLDVDFDIRNDSSRDDLAQAVNAVLEKVL